MKIIKKIKDIIFKARDYDRLKNEYIEVLKFATGGRVNNTECQICFVLQKIREHQEEVPTPSKQVQKILDRIGTHTWLVVSLYPNGRDSHFFRNGVIIREEELTEREREKFYSWTHAISNGRIRFQNR